MKTPANESANNRPRSVARRAIATTGHRMAFADHRTGATKQLALQAMAKNRLPNSSGQPTIQLKFAEDTTYGLEIEFRNRWVSPFNYGKALNEIDIEGSNGWKAGTDRGRTNSGYPGTVLEYESAVYSGADWKNGNADRDISIAFSHSKHFAEKVREHNKLDDPASKEQKLMHATYETMDQVHLRENALQIMEDHEEAPEATMQVTTLGRRTDAHIKTLHEVSDEMSAQSAIDMQKGVESGKFAPEVAEALQQSKSQSRQVVADLLKNGKRPINKADKLVMEDLESVTSVLVQSLVLAEAGFGIPGTIKNLVEPMPRRVIAPPQQGFMKRLRINDSVYMRYLLNFQDRISKIIDDIPPETLLAFAWYSKGAMKKGAPLYPSDEDNSVDGVPTLQDALYMILNEVEPGQRPSLWHHIAGSNPTLENKIIKQAQKKDPKSWTAHEIRNIFYAQKMSATEMKVYMDIIKKHIT